LGRGDLSLFKGDSPSPRGDNSERDKYTENFKKSPPEPADQFQSNVVQIILR
jgi:hypothetical protein